MAPKGVEMVLVVVLMTMFCAGASAQSNCTGVIVTLSPCLDYITGNSSTPSSGCCSQLATVVQSQVLCLCELLNVDASSLRGLNINRTLALQLPNACNIQTPAISLCNAVSPAGSPPATSGSGSNTDPSTDNPSDGSFVKLSYSLLFFLLFITSYASTF